MMGSDGESRLNPVVIAVHRAAMVSLGFIAGTLLYGGPFGFCPAWAALLEEVRHSGPARPGALWRIIRRGGSFWVACLPGTLAIGLAILLIVLRVNMESDLPAWLALPLVAWLFMTALHLAFGASLNLARRGPTMFITSLVLSSWLHLVVLTLWVGVAALAVTPALPLVVAFGPWLLGIVQVRAEGGLRRFLLS